MAPRRKQKKDAGVSIAIVVAIVLIASVALVLRPVPEQVVAMSEDGVVRVEGVTRSSSPLQIERLDGVETSIETIASPIYQISLEGGQLEDAEVVVLFSELDPDEAIPIQSATIYQFHRSTLSWESLPTLFDLTDESLSAVIDVSGSTMIGVGQAVQDK